MFRKISLSAVLLLLVAQNVNCAMKKSWKSAANFDAEIPKFTPFNNEEDLRNKPEASLNEVHMRTTQTPTVPSPSAETLSGSKIGSRIKAPPKHVAAIYNQFHHEMQKNTNKDFGTFGASATHDEPSSESPQQQLNEIVIEDEQIDIEQILSQLSDEADKNQIINGADDDDLEISSITNDINSTQYKVGPLMNLTIDSEDSLVNVTLDQTTLKEIFTGRGKKHSMLERVVPLFILPFLIQSAVIPFMVTMIKLFLLKSLFAGKIAILLLILGALKNHQNSIYMKSMQHSPYFLKDNNYQSPFPERRYETNFEGYKVEGKPESFVN